MIDDWLDFHDENEIFYKIHKSNDIRHNMILNRLVFSYLMLILSQIIRHTSDIYLTYIRHTFNGLSVSYRYHYLLLILFQTLGRFFRCPSALLNSLENSLTTINDEAFNSVFPSVLPPVFGLSMSDLCRMYVI